MDQPSGLLVLAVAPRLRTTGPMYLTEKTLVGYPALHRDFQWRTGYSLRLDDPQTFHQKIIWLKIRRPPRQFFRAVQKASFRSHRRLKAICKRLLHRLLAQAPPRRVMSMLTRNNLLCCQALWMLHGQLVV